MTQFRDICRWIDPDLDPEVRGQSKNPFDLTPSDVPAVYFFQCGIQSPSICKESPAPFSSSFTTCSSPLSPPNVSRAISNCCRTRRVTGESVSAASQGQQSSSGLFDTGRGRKMDHSDRQKPMAHHDAYTSCPTLQGSVQAKGGIIRHPISHPTSFEDWSSARAYDGEAMLYQRRVILLFFR